MSLAVKETAGRKCFDCGPESEAEQGQTSATPTTATSGSLYSHML